MSKTAGLGCLIRFPFGAHTSAVIVETARPFTGELLARVLGRFPGAVVVAPPAILQEIASACPDEDASEGERERRNVGKEQMRALASAHRVLFVGAPLAAEEGDRLARAGVRLVSAFGT